MPVYQLSDELAFPPPAMASPFGILAVGGDLRIERLLLAYRTGIFPWFSEGEPLLWWSPDPRLILPPGRVHISRSLKKLLKKQPFKITLDQAFERVIQRCATIERPGQKGTWIVKEMVAAYIELHRAGFAHSIEAWQDGRLAGGLYGVSIGRAFFGESMFSEVSNASKSVLVYLMRYLQAMGIELFDCQVTTDHLLSMGAFEITRDEFLRRLETALKGETLRGKWSLPEGLDVLPFLASAD